MKQHLEQLVDYLLENGIFLEQAVEVLEEGLIVKALLRTNGNQSTASKLLGIHRNTLQRKMDAYKLPGRRVKRKPMARAVAKKATKRSGT